jgi:hypothetical protein
MKNEGKSTTGIGKGAPSGFFISLLLHAATFLLAGILAAFRVLNNEENEFTQPKPVECPVVAALSGNMVIRNLPAVC